MIPVSDAILGMEDLLGRYRQEGQVESTGAFTLDPKKAIEKLASFQLPGPHHWILKVVQTLDRSGATFVDISAGVRKVTVKSDAVPEGFTSIDDLLGHLLVDANHCDPSLRHLAAGLQGSLQTKPRRIGISMVCQGERRDYDLAAGGWREKGRESTSKDGSHFELILQRSVEEGLSSGWFALNTDIFDLFFRRPGSYDRESLVVHDYCQYASCEVLLDGKSISDRRFGQARYPGYDISKDVDPGKRKVSLFTSMFSQEDLIASAAVPKHHLVEHLVPAREGHKGFRLSEENHATVSNRGELPPGTGLERAYAIRMQFDPTARLYFVEDGVVIDKVDQALGCPGLVALIDARELGKDLSTLKILTDERFALIVEETRKVGQTLRQTALEHLERMPAPDFVAARLKSVATES